MLEKCHDTMQNKTQASHMFYNGQPCELDVQEDRKGGYTCYPKSERGNIKFWISQRNFEKMWGL